MLVNFVFSISFIGSWKFLPLAAQVIEEANNDWEMKFQKISDPLVNPVLGAIEESTFKCPVRRKDVFWEAKDVFNPAAVVKDNKVYLLYRAEDRLGSYSGTSRIGLAWSEDGHSFKHRLTEPVLYPAHDDMNRHEWDGGCEDPRVVESPSGEYVMTYTAYDGTARLSVATSTDLITWEKRGPAFANAHGHAYRNAWTKSGSILVEPQPDGRLVAVKVNGTYWMYWGENDIHVATSDDLINWVPLMSEDPTHEYRGRPDHQDLPTGATKPLSVLRPRRGKFDSNLVEPGPPALLRDDGILFIYNSKNVFCDKEPGNICVNGEADPQLAPGTYSAGQALFSRSDPTQLLRRSEDTFFRPTEKFEITGQVGNVCFLEGLVYFKNKWLLYYGTADSHIAVAETSDYDYKGKIDSRKRGSNSKKPLFHPVRDTFSSEEVSARAQMYSAGSAAQARVPHTHAGSAGKDVHVDTHVASSSDLLAAQTTERAAPDSSSSSLHPAVVTDVTAPLPTDHASEETSSSSEQLSSSEQSSSSSSDQSSSSSSEQMSSHSDTSAEKDDLTVAASDIDTQKSADAPREVENLRKVKKNVYKTPEAPDESSVEEDLL